MRTLDLLPLALLALVASCDGNDEGDTRDTPDIADTADASDTHDIADTSDAHDIADTNDAHDVADTRDTHDIADTRDTSDTDEGDDTQDVADTSDTSVVADTADTTDDGEVVASDARLRMHVLDVGQGEAIILELPCGAMLVDTGGELTEAGTPGGAFDSTTALEASVRAFFAARPDLDDTFDLVVLSHPHIDHTRGVTRLLEMVEAGELHIANVVTNGYEASGNGPGQQRALHDFADADPSVGRWYVKQRTTGTSGVTNDVIDPFPRCDADGIDPVVTALWGDVDDPVALGWDDATFENANNHSVVLRVDYGAASLLMTGDLEDDAIVSLVAQYAGTDRLDVDLYKAGHHGSYNGTTAALVAAMSPSLAVISSGPPVREADFTAWQYGHPRWRAVSDLVGDDDSPGVTGARTPVDQLVATGYADGHGLFEPRTIARAVYCTGWEGTLVIGVAPDGAVARD